MTNNWINDMENEIEYDGKIWYKQKENIPSYVDEETKEEFITYYTFSGNNILEIVVNKDGDILD